jgi:hypothetical protein
MIGSNVRETRDNVAAAMSEFRRVLKKGGDLIVFDMSPWWPAWIAQLAMWNQARRRLGNKLDMFFWRASALQRTAAPALRDSRYASQSFPSSPFLVFPPVFSMPHLKVPRFLYPFDIMMYKWSL